MNCKVQCIGCAEIIDIAKVNPSVNPRRWRVFCPTCAGTFTTESNWCEVKEQIDVPISRPIECMGCDLPCRVVHVNTAIPVVYTWCLHCRNKMLAPHKWEEFVRVGEDPFPGYAPRVIEPGFQLRGH